MLSQHSIGFILVLTLTMREIRQWPSIAGMSLQSQCGDKEDRRAGLSSCIYITPDSTLHCVSSQSFRCDIYLFKQFLINRKYMKS